MVKTKNTAALVFCPVPYVFSAPGIYSCILLLFFLFCFKFLKTNTKMQPGRKSKPDEIHSPRSTRYSFTTISIKLHLVAPRFFFFYTLLSPAAFRRKKRNDFLTCSSFPSIFQVLFFFSRKIQQQRGRREMIITIT